MTQAYLPTPEQIEIEAALIRSEWSELERLSRERDMPKEERRLLNSHPKLKFRCKSYREPRVVRVLMRRKWRAA